MDDLSGRVALVTGGAAGIGLAIARALAHEGANVAVADVDAPAAERAAAELVAGGSRARAYSLDVARREQVDVVVDAVAADLGRLDILVNNAGISRVGDETQDVEDADWHDSIAVMQTGVFFCTRAVARHLLPQRSGAVLNVSSIRGFAPHRARLPYCAAKAAVLMMTRVTAAEWAPHGVRVNAIAPGFVGSPMLEADIARGAIDGAHLLGLVPAGRFGQPEEIGRLAAFLCSDAAAYITGACVTIDGGATSLIAG
jgi:3-oxoacyl-[acyl-carrier protein] reductase